MKRKAPKTLSENFLKQARDLGLLNSKTFSDTVEAYNFQISLIENLRKRIEKEGTSIMIPVGKDGQKLASNPAVSDLNKAEILAQKLRMELDGKVKAASTEAKAKEDPSLNEVL